MRCKVCEEEKHLDSFETCAQCSPGYLIKASDEPAVIAEAKRLGDLVLKRFFIRGES